MELRQQLQSKGYRVSSQQWLYPIFRFQGYRLTKTETSERMLLFYVEPQPHQVCCPLCHSREVIRRGEQVRWFRNVPVGSDCSWLIASLPRVECRACGFRFPVELLIELIRTPRHMRLQRGY